MSLLILALIAGVMGALGVILAAMAAHSTAGTGLTSASQMLLFHATAVLAGLGLLDRETLWRPALWFALLAWVLGTALFSGDIALRTFGGQRLFPMAAPTGGTILIVGWVLLAAAALVAMLRR